MNAALTDAETGADQLLSPSAESRLVDINLDAPFPNERTFSAARVLATARRAAAQR